MVGNTPNYTKLDVLRCFLQLDAKVSRQQLAKRLELGEGTIRSILDILKAKGLIVANNQGHVLGSKGIEVIKGLKQLMDIREVNLKLYPKLKIVAIALKTTTKITIGHRDLAVKAGAEGAIITYIKDGKLEQYDKSLHQDFEMLEKQIALHNGVLIIAFSTMLRSSENAGLSVALDMSKELGSIFTSSFT